MTGALRLANGTRADLAWIQLLPTFEYRETISLFFDDSVRTLAFPSPWLKQRPTEYRVSTRDGRTNDVRIAESYDEAFARELAHFHACITEGVAVPDSARAGPHGHRRPDADVPRVAMTRAAIVGTGFIGRVHAGALRSLGVEVAAVCSRTREGAEGFGEGRAYTDLDALLDSESIDVLHVCTPNNLHAAEALAALDRGVHVVCEKPLAVSTSESAGMVDAARERGLVGATCYHVRGYPLIEHMRSGIAEGDVGEIWFVHGRYLCDDVLFPASGWRTDPERSGSSYAVADLGTHWLDAAEHVTGLRVTEVYAEFRSIAGGPLEDYATLLLRFEGGATGSVVVSAAAPGRKNQLLLEIEGSKAGYTWDQEQPDLFVRRPAGEPPELVVKDPQTNAPSARALSRYPAGHGEGYGGAFRNLFASVYDAIEGGADMSFPTFTDGHHGVALVEAAVASAASDAWVAVPG